MFKQPRCSIYGIFTYIYHKFKPNVGKYSIHGAFEDIFPLISRFLKVGERLSFGGSFSVGERLKVAFTDFSKALFEEPKKHVTLGSSWVSYANLKLIISS